VPLDSTYLFERTADGQFVGPPGVAVPASGAADVPLEPYDNVLIMQEPQFDLQRAVVVSGQVRYPGTYSLRSKDERLADVIERAGGLTAPGVPRGHPVRTVGSGVGRVNVELRGRCTIRDPRTTSSCSPTIRSSFPSISQR